jgi:hypothetical protein
MYGSTHSFRTAAIVASAGLALLAAACGSSSKVGGLRSTSARGVVKAAAPANPAFQRGVEACQHILGHQFRFAFTPSGAGKGA